MKNPIPIAVLAACLLAASPADAPAEDWPMWRYDSSRGAWSPRELPESLHLQWVRELPAPLPAWPASQEKLQFDSQAEPIVMGERLFVPSSREDSITAFSTRTGEELWKFHADGPVRFSPVGVNGKVYFVSDDGHLYCLDASDGRLAWKVNGGPPRKRLILGNHRLISSWPARGGVVWHEERLFFAASIWPFMGIFIHAVDPDSGALLWTNSGDGTNYTVQPHNAPSFAGLVPQGHLAAVGKKLIVPGGRSTPGVFDTDTGRQLFFNFDRKTGGHRVGVAGDLYFTGEDACLLKDGSLITGGSAAVFNAKELIAADPKAILGRSTSVETEVEEKIDSKGRTIRVIHPKYRQLYRRELDDPAPGPWFLRAGPRLYAGGAGKIAAYEIDGKKPVWNAEVAGDVRTMLAGDDRLFALTAENKLYCFGGSKPNGVGRFEEQRVALAASDGATAGKILDHPGAGEGYALAIGIGSGKLIDELLAASTLHLIAVDPDAEKVERFRRRMCAAGLYGERVAAIAADLAEIELPPYLFNLIVSEEPAGLGLERAEIAKTVFETLRPYGGLACFELDEKTHASLERRVAAGELERAVLGKKGNWTTLVREGALPDTDDWTHQYANAAQTVVSRDHRVKAPFGVLWFGGPSHEGVLPRHGHGPSPQVAGGRLFIEGADMLRSVDVYTGRLLWEREIPGFGEYYDTTAHFPGAGEIGSNYVSLPDRVYALHGTAILELDAANGELLREYRQQPPAGRDDETPFWGSVRVSGDYLVATAAPVALDSGESPLAAFPRSKFGSGSRVLEVYDRMSGDLLWTREARFNFRHNNIAVADDRLFCIDRLTEQKEQALSRRGLKLDGKPVLYALDLKTGKILWERSEDVFGTFLNYSKEHDVVLQAGSAYRDRAKDEIGTGMMALRGSDGEIIWHDDKIDYGGPCLLWGDRILTNGLGGFAIDLMTGKKTGWQYAREYGCNTAVGSENVLTFRSGAAGFFDLANDSGTGNLGGFKSSCTANLIPANGVLNAPDYTRTCTCSYQNQTSLALVHMPEAEYWTFGGGANQGRMGVNFGAPGDRRSPEGTLFMEYPVVGGKSPGIEIEIEGKQIAYPRIHSSLMKGPEDTQRWVGASGVEGASKILWETGKDNGPSRVRLYFAEIDGEVKSGERAFDVVLQGKPVMKATDLAEQAGTRNAVLREFEVAPSSDGVVKIELVANGGARKPLLSGVELIWD